MDTKNCKIVLSRQNRAWLMLFCVMLNFHVPLAMAGPEGAQIVNGQVTFEQSGLNTTITASNRAIINYSSFNIGQPEVVQFVQPSIDASVLNRILSANPTNIDGTLLANGRVFFVNPAGVYIGAGAMINVNQLVASGLNISNADFIDGRYSFAGGNGVVANHGDIVAQKAYLIGRQITNSGTINCPDGYVVMASGDRVFLGEPGSNLMVSTDVPVSSKATDRLEGAAVLNAGSVEVGGGEIAFVAAGDVYAQAISNVGTLSASTDAGEAGSISLTAAEGTVANAGSIRANGRIAIEGATVENSGVLDASSRTTRMNGGNISITGGYIKNWGTITANAADYSKAGNVTVVAEQELTLEQTSRVAAKGKDTDSTGGDIYLYSHGNAQAKIGQVIDISGGTVSGDGGKGELSAARRVSIAGSVLGDAQEGYKRGVFTVDPQSAEVGGTYSADAVVWAEDDITVVDDVTFDGSLSLFADHRSETAGEWDEGPAAGTGSITRTGAYTISGPGTLSLKAAEDIGTSSNPIQTNAGALDVEIRDGYNGNVYIAEADGVELAGVKASTGSSRVQIEAAAGNISITGPVRAGTGGYYVEAKGGSVLFNTNGSVTGGGRSDLKAAGSIANMSSLEETIIETTNGGDLYLSATDAANSDQAMTIKSGGSLELNAPLGTDNLSAKTALYASGDLDISKSVKAQSIEAHSGTSGTGNLAFGPSVELDAPTIVLRAGDETGGGTGAMVDLSKGPTISSTTSFTLEQDATVSDTDVKDKLFPGNTSNNVNLTLTSYDSELRFITGTPVLDEIWQSINAIASAGIYVSAANLETNGNITFDAGTSGIHTSGNTINARSGDITFTSDTMNLGTSTDMIKTSGKVTLQPTAPTRTIGIGGAAGEFQLDDPEIRAIADGASRIIIGRENGEHDITVNGVIFKDPVEIRTPLGGQITVNGAITGTGDASVTLLGSGSTTTLNSDIVTSGEDITIDDSVLLGIPVTVTLDTTNGGAVATGANVTITGTIDNSGPLASALTLNGGTGGTVLLEDSVGAISALESLTAKGNTHIGGEVVRTTGFQTYNDDVTLGADTTTTLMGSDITFDKSVEGVKGMILNATGKLLAKGILWAKGGDVEVYASDDADKGINLEDNVTASQDILLKNNTKVLSGGKTLQASRDVVLTDGKTLTGLGSLTVKATGGTATFGGEVETAGTLDVTGPAIVAKGNITTSAGDLLLHGPTTVSDGKKLTASNNLTVDDGAKLTGLGSLTAQAGRNVTLGGAVESATGMKLNATGKVLAKGTLDAKGGDVEVYASDDADKGINLEDNVTASQDILLKNNTKVLSGGKTLQAGRDVVLTNGKTLTGLGSLTAQAGNDITLGGDTSADGKMLLQAGGTMWAKGKVATTDTGGTGQSDIEIRASDSTIKLGDGDGVDDVSAHRDLLLKNNTQVAAGGKLQAGRDVVLAETLTAEGDVTLKATEGQIWTGAVAGKVKIHMAADNKTLRLTQKERLLLTTGFDVTDNGDTTPKDTHLVAEVIGDSLEDTTADQWKSITATAESDVKLSGSGNITAGGLLKSDSGGVAVTSSAGALSLLDVTAKNDIQLLGNNAVAVSGIVTSDSGDVKVESAAGTVSTQAVTAGKNIELSGKNGVQTGSTLNSTTGNVSVRSTGGNLRIDGDINENLSEDTKSNSIGGVSLRADAGRVYTFGGANDTLNVKITGRSDQAGDIGVGLPKDSTKKAAIVIQSHDSLKIGANTTLTANGTYDPINSMTKTGSVDDRGAVDFKLDGDPIDVAIYLASYGPGSPGQPGVEVGSGNITIDNTSGNGALAVHSEKSADNAAGAVTFTTDFEDSLPNTIKHLEVASRHTQGLDWADYYDTLPHAGSAEAFAQGNFEYVLRGVSDLRVLERTGPASIAPPPIGFEPPKRQEVKAKGPTPKQELEKEFGPAWFDNVPQAVPGTLARGYSIDQLAEELWAYWTDCNAVGPRAAEFLNDQLDNLPDPNEANLRAFEAKICEEAAATKWVLAALSFVSRARTELGHSMTREVVHKLLPAKTVTQDTIETYLEVKMSDLEAKMKAEPLRSVPRNSRAQGTGTRAAGDRGVAVAR